MPCDYCGEPITAEEAKHPCHHNDGPLCCECEFEHFSFRCAWCCEHADIDDQDKVLVVFVECGVEPGLYKIKSLPYFGQPTIGRGRLYPDALKFWKPLPERLKNEAGFPCGHLCPNCITKAKGQ